MNGSAVSRCAKDLLKFYRRENEVGVSRIEMSASEFAAHRVAYLKAASVPFKTETIFLDHQTVQCGEGVPQEALDVRAGSSESGGINARPNTTGEAASPLDVADAECPRPAGEPK